MMMNLTKARLIIYCKRPRRVWEVWKWFNDYSYNYIASLLAQLHALGYLEKRTIRGNKRSKTFYTSTREAIELAENFLRKQSERFLEEKG